MPVALRIHTLREVAEAARTADDFSFALKDFLDGFYARPERSALEEEPAELRHLERGKFCDAYLAATAEHLSREHRWPVPHWSRAASRYLEQPSFGMTSHGGRMILLAESPPAFRVRNLFVSENALSRA